MIGNFARLAGSQTLESIISHRSHPDGYRDGDNEDNIMETIEETIRFNISFDDIQKDSNNIETYKIVSKVRYTIYPFFYN